MHMNNNIKFEYEVVQYQYYFPTKRRHKNLPRKVLEKSYLSTYETLVSYLSDFLGRMNSISSILTGTLTQKYNTYDKEYQWRKFTLYIPLFDLYIDIIKHRAGELNPDTFATKLMEDCNEAYYKAHH